MTTIHRTGRARAAGPGGASGPATEPATPQRAEREDHRYGPAQWLAAGGMFTVGWTSVRIVGWAVSDYLFLGSAAIMLLWILSGARSRIPPASTRRSSPMIIGGLVVFTLGGLLATFMRSVDPMGSALILLRIWYLTLIWFWILRSNAVSIRVLKLFLGATIAGAVFHSLVGIQQELTGANGGAPHWGRSVGLADHYSDFAASVGLVLPFVLLWPASERHSRMAGALLRAGAIAILLGGIATTGSQTPLGASIVGIAVALIAVRPYRSNRQARQRLLVLLLVVTTAGVAVASGQVELPALERFEKLTAGEAGVANSASSRFEMSELALESTVDSPLVGVGLDKASGAAANTVDTDSDQHQIHSFYLRTLFEAGVLGLLGLLAMLFVIVRQGVLLRRLTIRSPDLWLPAATLGSMTMVLVHASFGPTLFARYLWLPLALTTVLFGMAKGRTWVPAQTPAVSAPRPRPA